MTAFLTVVGKLVSLFIYLMVGYVIRRFNIVTKEFAAGMSGFLMKVTLPCMILITFQTDYTAERLTQAWQTYSISIVAYAISIAIGYISYRLCRVEREAKGVWVYSVVFPNQGFMGWPVIASILGSEALFHATFANMAFSTFAYTYGVWLMRVTGKNRDKAHSIKDDIFTPINGAIIIGLLMFFLQIRLPDSVNLAVSGMSNMTTPLAMIFVGTILARSPLISVLSDKRVYLVTLIRLFIIPAIVLAALIPMHLNRLVFGAIVLSHAMPVAGYAAIYAGEYGNDADLASKFISFSSLLCVITIPVFALFI